MKIEQAGYPYIEGELGIPFFEMTEGINVKIKSGSGKDLLYTAGTDILNVWDPENSDNTLFAVVHNGQLQLSLYPTPDGTEETKQHTDLYAGKFIAVAVNHFQRQGIKITHHLSDWTDGTNLRQYRGLWAQGADPDYAANNTWIGKKMVKMGFLPAESSDVTESDGNVFVKFWRENRPL